MLVTIQTAAGLRQIRVALCPDHQAALMREYGTVLHKDGVSGVVRAMDGRSGDEDPDELCDACYGRARIE